MRLLYLSPTASIGGAERVLLDLLRGIRRAQPSWVVGLIVANDGPLADDARRLGVTVFVLPFPRAFARIGDAGLAGPGSWLALAGRAAFGGLAMIGYVRHIRRQMAAFEPDVVHSNGFKMHVLGALAKPANSALIWHFHDYLGSRRVTRRIIHRLKHRCAAMVAVSESVAVDLRRQLGDSIEIAVIWNAVDLAHFTSEGPRLDLDALSGLPAAGRGVVRVGLVATFARWKGHRLFLEMLKALMSTQTIRGYVVGGPMYETAGSQCTHQELSDAIDQLGLRGSVGLTGFVTDPATALRALDVVVHASTSPEPFGLVIAEAMASGRAVVVSDAGGAAELVEGERDALTYPQGDVLSLTRQVERLVVDPAMRLRLGLAARQSAAGRFGQGRFARQMLRLYTQFDREAAA